MRDVRALALVAACLMLCAPASASAADLQPPTATAYHAYVEQAREMFLQRVAHATAPETHGRTGLLFARPARRDGIIGVDGGLIHHWIGATFIDGVTLQRVLHVSMEYNSFSTMYKNVLASRQLAHEGNRYRVLVRLKEEGSGISAVVDITSTVDYSYPGERTAIALSTSDEIRQVLNAGRGDEQLLPAGHDSGYLWRADTFSYMVETGNGVYVETETIGLSRPFPRGFAWFIKPIARRLGRKSVETSLLEFAAAIKKSS
jgi:hypothetical protein